MNFVNLLSTNLKKFINFKWLRRKLAPPYQLPWIPGGTQTDPFIGWNPLHNRAWNQCAKVPKTTTVMCLFLYTLPEQRIARFTLCQSAPAPVSNNWTETIFDNPQKRSHFLHRRLGVWLTSELCRSVLPFAACQKNIARNPPSIGDDSDNGVRVV